MTTASIAARIKVPAVNKIARREDVRAKTARLPEIRKEMVARTETVRTANLRGSWTDQALAETAAAKLKSIQCIIGDLCPRLF